MSDVLQDGATIAPQDATNSTGAATDALVGDAGNAAGGVSDAGQSQGETSALDASGLSVGEQGNASGAGTNTSVSDANSSNGLSTSSDANAADSGSQAIGAEVGEAGNGAPADTGALNSDAAGTADPNASAGADPANPSAPLSADCGASASAGESLLGKIESLALAAFNSGRTEEHNLMAWLHTHLTGARAASAGADGLEGLTDEAKAILAELKSLL